MSDFLSGTVTAHLTFEESIERTPAACPSSPTAIVRMQIPLQPEEYSVQDEHREGNPRPERARSTLCRVSQVLLEDGRPGAAGRAHYIKHYPDYVQNYLEQERKMKEAYAKAQADHEAQQAQAQAQAQYQYQGQQSQYQGQQQYQGNPQYPTYSQYPAQSQQWQ
ncbi:hypothetical protein EXIGLDRAFT_782890 [Exidia glandulosa HHB12029]|uniref:Uncharacterized protein n=1 Tax=Exidia glandulosa HHB12029 TaxID=1314781 RepID=A0A166NDP0_EXIGL|nr:hypothetical protein EXIGLDRAFT_782890 [Exidia glandulosa HHB12029]